MTVRRGSVPDVAPGAPVNTGVRLFYDGDCGLCHLAVRLAARADRSGTVRFAPLEGETSRELIPEPERARLPDSLVLREADGTLRVRSAAVVALLRHFGGPWQALAATLDLLPGALADRLYDAVARMRRRLFRRPREACPSLPPRLRARFDP